MGPNMVRLSFLLFARKRRSPRRARTGARESRLTLLTVWCWGWDGAGDLDGPDVDPIWEEMPKKAYADESIVVKHYRNMPGW